MEASEYELIIYIGIAEYSQDLKGYIEMEQLKALDKHINKKMFYTRLCRSIETIVNKYNNRLQRDLADHARHMEMDRQAPEGQKFGFPTELPTLYSFGFPLFALTGGKYKGDVYFNHVEAFAKAIEANNSELQHQEAEKKADIANAILEFSITQLTPKILPYAKERGYFSFTPVLNELLQKARAYNNIEIESTLLLNVHELCKENASSFWSEAHRKQISEWLNSSSFKPTKFIKVGELENGEPKIELIPLFTTTWISKIEPQPNEAENNFTLSTIEDWLFEFKNKMSVTDYQILVSALETYLNKGTFPKLKKPIQINGRPNIKLFGWALNRIFEAKGKGIEKELLQFAKHNISLFLNVDFDENNILKSNLYKYFTTKTK